jgi:transposase
VFGCQQVLINDNKQLTNTLKFVCSEANKLTNCGVYYARQVWFKIHKYLGKFDLINEYKTNCHYQTLHSQGAQQTLLSVRESFKSYYELDKKFRNGELEYKPKLPNYRKKDGFAVVSYPKQALRLKNNEIQIPLGLTVARWFGLKNFSVKMPSNLKFEDIRELRILPRNRCFYIEFVYKLETQKADVDFNEVIGIDHGLSNWLTCVSNVGPSIIIDGLHLKSLNQFYNKQISTIKEKKPKGFWSKRLAAITEKRNRQMRDAVNKAARIVINHCLNI